MKTTGLITIIATLIASILMAYYSHRKKKSVFAMLHCFNAGMCAGELYAIILNQF